MRSPAACFPRAFSDESAAPCPEARSVHGRSPRRWLFRCSHCPPSRDRPRRSRSRRRARPGSRRGPGCSMARTRRNFRCRSLPPNRPGSRIDLPCARDRRAGGSVHVLGWVLLIAFGALVLLTLGRDLIIAAGKSGMRRSAEEPTEATETIDFEFPDPEALASQGRFAEAIHILLLRALTDWSEGKGLVPDSLTSRGILRRVHLPPGAGGGAGRVGEGGGDQSFSAASTRAASTTSSAVPPSTTSRALARRPGGAAPRFRQATVARLAGAGRDFLRGHRRAQPVRQRPLGTNSLRADSYSRSAIGHHAMVEMLRGLGRSSGGEPALGAAQEGGSTLLLLLDRSRSPTTRGSS